MLKLTTGNSECRIENLSLVQFKELKEVLSYDLDPQAKFFGGGYRSTKQSLLTKNGSFPTGLLYLVEQYLDKKHVESYILDDKRIKPAPKPGMHHLKLVISPYPAQLAAVSTAVHANRGVLSMPTGTGKSITMAMLVNELQLRTLIIVPNLSLKQQLTEDFKQYFGANSNITIANIDSRSLIKETDYDVLIIDESHHSAAKTYRTLNKKAWTGIYHRYFFTATPYRSREEERLLLESVAGRIIYELTYAEAINNKYILPVEAYYIEVPKQHFDTNSWPEFYSKMVVKNQVRNEAIASLVKALGEAGASTLCLVKEIAHGSTLTALIDTFFANGESEDTPHLIKMFSDGKLKTLVGTTGVIGEGVDTRACEYVVIAGLGKSKPQFLQQVGRAVRRFGNKDSAKVVLVLDRSHKYSRDHFKVQCKHLLEVYGVTPQKLEVIDA